MHVCLEIPNSLSGLQVRWAGDRCTVCDSDVDYDQDQLVSCDMCGITVHQSCYGVQELPGEDDMWLCRACELKVRCPLLFLCLKCHAVCVFHCCCISLLVLCGNSRLLRSPAQCMCIQAHVFLSYAARPQCCFLPCFSLWLHALSDKHAKCLEQSFCSHDCTVLSSVLSHGCCKPGPALLQSLLHCLHMRL